jgi:hypothetical protein
MPLLRSPSAKSLSLVAIPAPVSIGAMVAALARLRKLVWHRSCYCSTDSLWGPPRGSFPQIPASPEEAPGFGKIAHMA